MLPYFWYMLKVIICSGILFGYYWFFLRNKIFHQYNRFYLLAAMSLSLLLPLLKINFWQQDAEKNQAIRVLQAVSAGDEYMNSVAINAHKSNWSFEQLYVIVYWMVCIILFLVMLRTLYLIRTLLKKYPVQQVEQVAFVNTEDDSTPFSFLKYIFWNSSIDINTTTGRQIFKHEVAHIQEKHTHDKLFVNIILIFCWCNPFFWLYRKELNMIHEFIADKKAVEDSDTAAFAAMILQAAYPRHRFELTNNFFYSPIKRRLLMLTKNKNPKVNYIGRIMVLPLIMLVFVAFSLKAKSENAKASLNKINLEKIKPIIIETSPAIVELPIKKRLVLAADTVPPLVITGVNPKAEPPLYVVNGHETDKAIALNIKPEEIDTVRVINKEMALRIYGEKGKNGVVIINMKSGYGSPKANWKADTVRVYDDKGEPLGQKPLIIIDGNEYLDKTIDEIAIIMGKPKFIKVEVYTGEKAIKMYGENAKDGVMVFNTKQLKEDFINQNGDSLQFINQEPKLLLGNNSGGTISLDYLKTIKEISVSSGITFLSGTLYIQGPGFDKNVLSIQLRSASLSSVATAFNRCRHGAQLVFDAVKVKDKNGDERTLLTPLPFIVYDKETNN